MGLFSSNDEELPDKWKCDPQGEYVTNARIEKSEDILDKGEKPHYITRGSTVDVEGSSAGSSLFGDDRSRKTGTRGYVRAVFTDRRVAIKVPQWLGSDERSVPYDSITSVDLDTGLVNKRISLQTPGQTYHIEAQEPGKEQVREVVKFVRNKISEANKPDTVVAESEPDPLDQIEKLSDLHERGVISDEEFEKKRESLLDKV